MASDVEAVVKKAVGTYGRLVTDRSLRKNKQALPSPPVPVWGRTTPNGR